ncbi:GAF domain-containing protein [Halobacterium litoreum]|uniref:GAF domain-containing protein n=1 Tax=Halobacterium litoreum TaxID=2039234 RepID=A0ABD5N954_9EURY|nr:GAF domain-containing protein [Halobacterium litoreum]UHH12066.1 GAF domain-containing protein [Halobacterium litoreum]
MTERTVLCVDTEDDVGATASTVEDEPTLTAVEATTVADARSTLESEAVDCVVTEYELEDGSGLEVVDAIREETPQTPCVLFTDARPGDVDTSSFEDLIVEYLGKHLPDAHDRLGFVVDDVITHSSQVGFLLPDNEDERLEALAEYDVDELPIEESFERLTDLIASHFDTAVAFIGLVERDEEDILACHGADWGSITREDTICTHSMLQEDVMVVEDISSDKRFDSNEGLHNLGIVSYAGANMTTDSGEVIGQVCLIDHEPRTYDADQRADLQQFADEAMEMLELRQRVIDAEMEVAQ